MNIDDDQFDRQKRVASWSQNIITSSKVCVVGAGALGNEVVKNLLQLGVVDITVIDFDDIVVANLNRCVFFSREDVGKKKADVIAAKASQVNLTAIVKVIDSKVELLSEATWSEFGFVFSCLDNLGARLHINAHTYGKCVLIDGGTTGFMGKVQVVSNGSCLECSLQKRDYDSMWRKYSCVGDLLDIVDPKMPALPTTTSVVSALMVGEFVKIAHKMEGKMAQSNTFEGKYLFYNGVLNAFSEFNVQKRKDCPVHSSGVEVK